MSMIGETVLRSLRVKGRAGTADLALSNGLDEPATEESLVHAAEQGWVRHRSGRLGGWSLTPEGRAVVTTTIAAQRASLDTGEAAARYDGRFLPLNAEFKRLCTHCQLDGADPRDDLPGIHERVTALCTDFDRLLPGFGHYRGRFDRAYQRICDGDPSALTAPLSGSYHDVWIELHEHLLLMFDRARENDD